MPRLTLKNFAQIRNVSVEFGDLTLIIGPQATGKSLFLQWAKLAFDAADVVDNFRRYGLSWKAESTSDFCDLYFGSGYGKAVHRNTTLTIGSGKPKALSSLLRARVTETTGKLYYIPAHRSLLMADGWPRPFQQYFSDTPYVARICSERLRVLLTSSESNGGKQLFPQLNRLKAGIRSKIDEAIFHGASMHKGAEGGRQRLVLSPNKDTAIPYMAWTAGQREFGPMLLSLYDLIPAAASTRRKPVEHVVLEEPELGLHPNAIMVCMILIVELLYRGYRVTISTHSPLLTTIAWALGRLQKAGATAKDYSRLLGLPNDCANRAASLLAKKVRVFHFDYVDKQVESIDISHLDPSSKIAAEAGWGGLSGVPGNLARGVARVVSATNEVKLRSWGRSLEKS